MTVRGFQLTFRYFHRSVERLPPLAIELTAVIRRKGGSKLNSFQRKLFVPLGMFVLAVSLPVSLALADESVGGSTPQPGSSLQAETAAVGDTPVTEGTVAEGAATTDTTPATGDAAMTGPADTGEAATAESIPDDAVTVDEGIALNGNEAVKAGSYGIADFAALHASDLSDGNYTFATSKDSKRVLDVRGGSTQAGAAAQIYTSNQTDAQVWTISHDAKGFVTIASAKSGKVLDCMSGSSANGTRLQLWNSNGTMAQKWIVAKVGNGYVLVSALSAKVVVAADGTLSSCKVIDLPGGSTSSGLQIQLYEANGTAAQLWMPSSAKTSRERAEELAVANASVVADGTYALCSVKAGRSVLDVSGASSANGANVQIWSSNATKAQRWIVSHDKHGYLTLTNAASGKVLDVARGSAAAGANVHQWASNGSLAQKWIAVPHPSGGFELISALDASLTLDLSSGSTANGANAQLWSRNGTLAQAFTFARCDVSVAAGERVNLLEGSWWTMTPSCASDKVLDVSGASTNNGANVQLWSANSTLAQFWQLEWANGYYRIYNAASGKCLDVAGGDAVPGTNVQQWTRANTNNQLFAVKANQDGTYTFVNKATGLALDIQSAGSANGTNLNAWTLNYGTAQRFFLTKPKSIISTGAYTISPAVSSSRALDVENGSSSSGANVRSWISNGSFAQKWYVSAASGYDGEYYIECMGSIMRLAADSSGNVCQRSASGDASQRWKVSVARGGYVFESVAYPGKMLDLNGASSACGANVQVYTNNGSSAQIWRLSSCGIAVSNGTYTVRVASSPSVTLDVAGGSTSAGGNVQLYTSNDSGAQKWLFTRKSDGAYEIKNAASGKALDVANAKAASGANVQQWTANNSAAQRWRVEYRAGSGFVFVSSLGSSLALGSSRGAVSGANAQLANSGDALSFTLRATTYIPSNQQQMVWKAQGYYSSTNWLILADTTNNKVAVFSGSRGSWTIQKFWDCTSGAFNTPTKTGEFTVGSKGYSFGEEHGYSCYYWTQFYGAYLFHSVKYYANTRNIMDGRLGVNASAGCLRLQIDNAKWIYDNIPRGTKVIVYR